MQTLADLEVWPCRICGVIFTPPEWKRKRSDRACSQCSTKIRAEWIARTGWAHPEERRKAYYRKASAKSYADPAQRVHHAARAATRYAIKSGRLIRQPCEVCGTSPAEAHHDDYSQPLNVRWLCRPHHRQHHDAERALRRAA